MDLTGYVGLGRGLGLERALEVISGNVANADSIGFKRQDMVFQSVLKAAGEPRQVAFGQERGTAIDAREGPLKETGASLDVALVGEGWFKVRTTDGDRFTRAGHFQTDATGSLVTSSGAKVLDTGGAPIVIPPDARDIAIAQDGTVTVDGTLAGRIGVVRLERTAELSPEGSGLYRSDEPGAAAGDARVVQGSLEGSNVQPVLEMTRLIEVTRAFESTQRLLETHHDLARQTVERMLEVQG